MRCCLACNVFGDGGLDPGGAECKYESEHRRDELVDSHSFLTVDSGEEDTVEKAQNTRQKAGGSQDDRALDKLVVTYGMWKLAVKQMFLFMAGGCCNRCGRFFFQMQYSFLKTDNGYTLFICTKN